MEISYTSELQEMDKLKLKNEIREHIEYNGNVFPNQVEPLVNLFYDYLQKNNQELIEELTLFYTEKMEKEGLELYNDGIKHGREEKKNN